jgi:uncharacterized flavoprotein (TIGR03862 family)
MARVIVIGGGPAGLMAADVMSAAGVGVSVFDGMPSIGRKLLLAGRGGLNLTHSEPLDVLLGRYGAARDFLADAIREFPPDALREFAHDLGVETFVGTSGRVFPRSMKASPLLRAWLARLSRQGVELRTRHRFVGFDEVNRPLIAAESRPPMAVPADAVVLALGGGSWPRLGSDGAWVRRVADLGIRVQALEPANVGIKIDWSDHFRERFSGEALKRIAIVVGDDGQRGEAVVTVSGLEGGAVYALTPALRQALARGEAEVRIDLRPDIDASDLAGRLSKPRGKQSMATWLRKTIHLAPVAIALLRERWGDASPTDALELARTIKDVRLPVTGLCGLERAISSAGGISLDEGGPQMMLRRLPGLFVAGEMLDWEAPTGGYLLQGCFATGHAAGRGVLGYLAERSS